MKKIASRKDPRILDLLIAHGASGYGLYVMLVEYLGERKALRSTDDIRRIAYELHADAETVSSILRDFNLFEIDPDGNIAREGARSSAESARSATYPPITDDASEHPLTASPSAPLPASMSRSERRRQLRIRQKGSAIHLRV